MPAADPRPTCNTRGPAECSNDAEFSIRADGYPCPMFAGVCRSHLGPILAGDASSPGSTLRWIVEALR